MTTDSRSPADFPSFSNLVKPTTTLTSFWTPQERRDHTLRRRLGIDRFMSFDEAAKRAPSIAAAGPHSSRSDRYSFVNTAEVAYTLDGMGFGITEAAQGRVRKDPTAAGFTQHLLRFAMKDAPEIVGAPSTIPEVLFINSSDGRCGAQFMAGALRGYCLNRLVFGEMQGVSIAHRGPAHERIMAALHEIMRQHGLHSMHIAEMAGTIMMPGEQLAFARDALAVRFPGRSADASGSAGFPITPEQILTPNIREDDEPTVWNVFNRVQAWLINGGLPGRTANSRRTTTRPVKSIRGGLEVNTRLFGLALDFIRRLKK